MQKFVLNNISLNCYMQQATEINERECHNGVISMNDTGVLRFEENAGSPHKVWVRNPQIYKGTCVNMARMKDGQLKFFFRWVNTKSPNFVAENYAFRVYSEISEALKSIE